MKHRFIIYGYYGWHNSGDDAMLYALLRELHVRFPRSTFTVPTRAPVTIPEGLDEFVSLTELKPWTVLREIMRSSVFVIGGGTHFPIERGFLIKRLAVLTGLLTMITWAKVFGNRICLIGIGVEPAQTIWGKSLSKCILRLADFISVRDTATFELVKSMGFERKSVLSFDLSALLVGSPVSSPHSDCQIRVLTDKECSPTKIGVSILPFFEIYTGDKDRDKLLVHRVAEALNKWLEKDTKNTVCLFTVKGSSKQDDVLITDLLRANLRPPGRVRLVPYNSDPREVLYHVGRCDAFIGMRYHSCVFAYLSRLPLLIINYFNKCQALGEDIKLPHDALITPDEVLEGVLDEKLTELYTRPNHFIAELPI
jgi:polysaccharide pyruvyl transferase WcaK-like protein